MRKIGLTTFIVSVAASSFAMADPLKWIEGYWEVDPNDFSEPLNEGQLETLRKESCEVDPWRIFMEPGTNRMSYKHSSETFDDPLYNYVVSEVHDKHIALGCSPEALPCSGYEWYIYFLNEDRFVWVRDEWRDENDKVLRTTVARQRCKNTERA